MVCFSPVSMGSSQFYGTGQFLLELLECSTQHLNLAQMTEEASCAVSVLAWTGTQSVLHDYMHTLSHSCSTN